MAMTHSAVRKLDVRSQKSVGDYDSVAWTVWNKSSMPFHGSDGFSVFDNNGRLAMRVDNYSRRSKYAAAEIVLMDGRGKALITLKPRILSMHDRWNGFRSSEHGSRELPENHIFSMRRKSLFHSKGEVEVFMGGLNNQTSTPDFWSEGCFRRRCCKIWSNTGEIAAVITRKKVNNSVTLGDDVFSLVVSPGFTSELIMAFVVVMDRICERP